MKTPKTDAFEVVQGPFDNEHFPNYKEALSRLRRYENALWEIRESNRDTNARRIARKALES